MWPIKRLICALIHLRALNTCDLLLLSVFVVVVIIVSFFIVLVVALVADRERAQRTDFLEAYKQTKKHLKVNKNLIPKIQFQFGTDADVDVDSD